jgi:hypothetical protein
MRRKFAVRLPGTRHLGVAVRALAAMANRAESRGGGRLEGRLRSRFGETV